MRDKGIYSISCHLVCGDFPADDFGYRFLLASRALRSAGLIYMTIAMPLYLAALHVGVARIGLVVLAVVLFNAVLAFLIGAIGDRVGYKPMLIIAELFPLCGALLLGFSSNIYLIVVSLVVAGISGSAGALRGAFSPGLTALISSNWGDEKERVRRFGEMIGVGAVFGVVGSLMLVAYPYVKLYDGAAGAFRALFLVAALFLALSVVSLLLVRERKRPAKTTRLMKKASGSYIERVMVSGIINGAGVGLAMPLLPLWFALMYHASTSAIGIIFGASYLATALGSFVSSRMASRFDILKVASAARFAQGAFIIAMALSPLALLAASFYVARAIVAGFGSPTRFTTTMRGINNEDYGTAAAAQGVTNRLAQSSAGLSGYAMEQAIPLPLEIGGALQLFAGIAYYKLLKNRKKAN